MSIPLITSDPASGVTGVYTINIEWAALLAGALLEYEYDRIYASDLSEAETTLMIQRCEELQSILLSGGNTQMTPYVATLHEIQTPPVMALPGQEWTRRKLQIAYDPEGRFTVDVYNTFRAAEDTTVFITGWATGRNTRQLIARIATAAGGTWLTGSTGFSVQSDNNTSGISHISGVLNMQRTTPYALDTWAQYQPAGVSGYDYTTHGANPVTAAISLLVIG